MIKYCLSIFIVAFLCQSFEAQGQKLKKLNFKTVEEMYAYFKYADGKKIISGHRGTIEENMPENSIPSMEAVLKHTSAILK